MSDINIIAINAAKMAVTSDDEGIREDLYQYFRYQDPNFFKNPKSKSTFDGSIRLYSKRDGTMGYGLLSAVIQFAKDRQLSISIDPAFKDDIKPVTQEDIDSWIDTLDIRTKGEKIEPYEYQKSGVWLAAKYSRMTLLAATSAGKSLLQYLIIRFLLNTVEGRILLVVPSINLVTQMYSDFEDYSSHDDGWNAHEYCHMVHGGISPYTNKRVVISTWQSLSNLSPDYFHQFSGLLGDECHLYNGKSLSIIAMNCINAYNRVGLTGTLRKDKIHPLQIQQHFATIKRIVTTKQLQDSGRASKTKIKVLQLEYPTEQRKALTGDYQAEIDFLIHHEYRNKVIKGLARTLKGNTLILFERVDAHLHVIAEELQKEAPERRVLIITGDVHNDERNLIKAELEVGDDITLLASTKTLSTGVSIKKLHNLVFCFGGKGVIKVLQSIGRMLRLHDSKDVAMIYDIVDVLMFNGIPNFSMKHAGERLGFYRDEQHPVEVKKMIVPA